MRLVVITKTSEELGNVVRSKRNLLMLMLLCLDCHSFFPPHVRFFDEDSLRCSCCNSTLPLQFSIPFIPQVPRR